MRYWAEVAYDDPDMFGLGIGELIVILGVLVVASLPVIVIVVLLMRNKRGS